MTDNLSPDPNNPGKLRSNNERIWGKHRSRLYPEDWQSPEGKNIAIRFPDVYPEKDRKGKRHPKAGQPHPKAGELKQMPGPAKMALWQQEFKDYHLAKGLDIEVSWV